MNESFLASDNDPQPVIHHNDNEGVLSVSKKLIGLFLGAAFLTFIYSIFLLNSYWGFGFTVVNCAFIITLITLRHKDINRKDIVFLLLSSLLLSLFIPLRSYGFGRVVTFLAVYILNCLAVARMHAQPNTTLTLKEFLLVPIDIALQTFSQLIFWFNNIILALTSLRTNKEGVRQNSKVVINSILIALPILVLFTLLFVSADPLFEKYFRNILTFLPKFTINWELVIKTIHLTVIFGLFSSLLTGVNRSFTEMSLFESAHKYRKELAVATILIASLIGSFLVVQTQYLFATDQLLQQMGVMLSEYTRRGYTELLIVSTFSLIIIAILIKAIRGISHSSYRIIACVYITEVLLLLASATRRVYLYQDRHGFTQIRLLGVILSIWLASVLILFFIRVMSKYKDAPLFFSMFIISVLTIFLMQGMNIDYLSGVVKQPNLGSGVTDYRYITKLSSDAWQGWDQSITYLATTKNCTYIESQAIYNLDQRYQELNNRSQNNWSNMAAWSSSDAQALEMLKKRAGDIAHAKGEQKACLLKQQMDIYTNTSPSARPLNR